MPKADLLDAAEAQTALTKLPETPEPPALTMFERLAADPNLLEDASRVHTQRSPLTQHLLDTALVLARMLR